MTVTVRFTTPISLANVPVLGDLSTRLVVDGMAYRESVGSLALPSRRVTSGMLERDIVLDLQVCLSYMMCNWVDTLLRVSHEAIRKISESISVMFQWGALRRQFDVVIARGSQFFLMVSVQIVLDGQEGKNERNPIVKA